MMKKREKKTGAAASAMEEFRLMVKHGRFKVAIIAAIIVIGVVLHYVNSYHSVGLWPLRTDEARAFRTEILSEYDSVTKVSIDFWWVQNLTIKVYAKQWTRQEAERVLEHVKSLMLEEAFLASYAQKYASRYETVDAAPLAVQVHFFERSEVLPIFHFSSQAPFSHWDLTKDRGD